MRDQRVSGDTPRHGPDGPSESPDRPEGSRTPGAGAANGRRVPINIETPPLSLGSLTFGSPSDIRFHLPAPGTPISVEGPVSVNICNRCGNPAPFGRCGYLACLADIPVGPLSASPSSVIGSHPPAPGRESCPRAHGGRPSHRQAASGAGTRLLVRAFFSVVTPVVFFLFFWALLFGYLAISVLSWGRR